IELLSAEDRVKALDEVFEMIRSNDATDLVCRACVSMLDRPKPQELWSWLYTEAYHRRVDETLMLYVEKTDPSRAQDVCNDLVQRLQQWEKDKKPSGPKLTYLV